MKPYWSLHNHSKFSVNDALSDVNEMVNRAVELDYPALALTDHGTVAGVVSHYKACRKQGIEPLPGVELYVTPDRESKIQGHNLHLTVAAYSEQGYRNLCRLVTTTARHFHYKPRVDFSDLAQMAEEGATSGLAIGTGCWFGLVPSVLRDSGFSAASHVVETLAGWFPKVYVELQAHGVEQEGEFTEEEMVETLIDISQTTGVPYIITTDAHYVRADHQPLHDGLKRMLSWDQNEPDSAMFPGGPYSMLGRTDLGRYFEPHTLDVACDTLAELSEHCSVRLPEVENFRMLVPDVTPGQDPQRVLDSKIHNALQLRDDTTKEEIERAQMELDVVDRTGMAGYLLLVTRVCDFMRSKGIVFNTRGSANDSMLCYLLGITGVNSQERGLRFERFMSVDRIKPPDIDLDVEHERRPEVAMMLAEQFPILQVGTIMKYSLSGDDEAIELDEEDSAKGSLRVKYFSAARRQGAQIESWTDVPPAERKMLHQLSDLKLISGYGKHPAGFVVAPDQASIRDLPKAYIASSRTFISAYGKDDVEDLGFTKLDLLGLKTLTAVRRCVEEIQTALPGHSRQTPMEFIESIPDDDPETMKRIRDGKCEGLFQLGGADQSRSVPRMGPKRTDDLIVAQALFRPAAKAIQADYLGRRKRVDPIPPMHADLWAETKKTYGLLIYQEQVIGALRRIGMSIPELNSLLKAVKASNEYVAGAKVAIASALPRIRALAAEQGWSESDVALLVDAVSGYADYGFNEAHAVAYGLLAYRTAWLATHHPLEWWFGMLTAYSGTKREGPLSAAARRYGVRIQQPHVNRSGMSYRVDHERQEIRRGLMSVKGVGPVAAEEISSKAPFRSLLDLGQRVMARKVGGAKSLALQKDPRECGGAITALWDIDALDGLPDVHVEEEDVRIA